MEIKPGSKFGNYELLGEISRRGSFGVVWRVKEIKPYYQRELALKIVNKKSVGDKSFLREEASHWAIADGHPNVVSFLGIVEVEDDDGQIGFLSHFHEGGTLATWLEGFNGRAPSLEVALRMIIDILDGIEHLHKHNVVHRDLKPENILLAGQKPMLMDFGSSKIVEEGLPKTTDYSGTDVYSSPEAFRKGKGRSVDIWAAGVVLYVMLEGFYPFFGPGKTQIKQCIFKKPPREFQFDIPPGLRNIVLRALEKSPKNRYQSAAEMRLALEAFAEKEKPKLEKALAGIESAIRGEAKTTRKISAAQDGHIKKTDAIAADVKKLVDKESKTEFPPINPGIKALLEKGVSLRNAGKYREAKVVFDNALSVAEKGKDKRTVAAAKRYKAMMLKDIDRNHSAAKLLLEDCVRDFRELQDEKHLAMTFYDLGVNEVEEGNLDQATAYLNQSLELDKKNNVKDGTASTLQQLGRIESERGNKKKAIEYEDQALQHFLSLYNESPKDADNDISLWIAGCYQNKGLMFEDLGRLEDAESNYLRSLEWHRKTGYKFDLGKLLFLLARLKYREAKYEEGSPFLDEAIEIYSEIEAPHLLARCLDMKGRLSYTLGKLDDAISAFETSLEVATRSENPEDQAIYLSKLGRIYLKDKKDAEKARGFFEKARDLTEKAGELNGFAEALEDLAHIAQIEKNIPERDRLLSQGIAALEKLLLRIEAESKKAFLFGQIGFFYERMEDLAQALIYYQRAFRAYESFEDIGGIANSLGSIGRVKGRLGKKNEEFDTYREIKKRVDGTPYYEIIAGTAINLGEINLQIGNVDEAKMLFDEADFLCRKYRLSFSEHLKQSFKRLDEHQMIHTLPDVNFEQLVTELIELINWFPEAKDSLLRLWLTGRIETLLANFRSMSGVKFMVCEDNVSAFLELARNLRPYMDVCLQAVSSEFQSTGMDIVPFPLEKSTFFDFSVVAMRRSNSENLERADSTSLLQSDLDFEQVSRQLTSRYYLTSDNATSKITGNTGGVFVGWSLGLPEQAHDLLLTRSAEELLSRKVFFLPHQRHLFNDKLRNDLTFFGKEVGLIPVYSGHIPASESVRVLLTADLELPILSEQETEVCRRQIRKVKRALMAVLSSTKDSVHSAINDVVFEVGELSDASDEFIDLQIVVFEFPHHFDVGIHVGFFVRGIHDQGQ